MFDNMINHNQCPGHVLNDKTVIDGNFVLETKYCIICSYVEGTTWRTDER